jgi:hypothetical protein
MTFAPFPWVAMQTGVVNLGTKAGVLVFAYADAGRVRRANRAGTISPFLRLRAQGCAATETNVVSAVTGQAAVEGGGKGLRGVSERGRVRHTLRCLSGRARLWFASETAPPADRL